MTGQNLIRAAELRGVTTELQKFQTAAHTFQDQYFALPGDMTNATAFWGTLSACGGSDADGTCDGDGGDGNLGKWASGAGLPSDGFLFWQHLEKAGLIEGTFSGLAGPDDGGHSVAGTNTPLGKLSNSYWVMNNWNNSSGASTQYFAYDYGNYLNFQSLSGGDVLTAEEAWNVDAKVDDGKPAYGMVIGAQIADKCSVADDGTSTNDDFEASYNLSDTSLKCRLMFRDIF